MEKFNYNFYIHEMPPKIELDFIEYFKEEHPNLCDEVSKCLENKGSYQRSNAKKLFEQLKEAEEKNNSEEKDRILNFIKKKISENFSTPNKLHHF